MSNMPLGSVSFEFIYLLPQPLLSRHENLANGVARWAASIGPESHRQCRSVLGTKVAHVAGENCLAER